jgi:hypothetical protein
MTQLTVSPRELNRHPVLAELAGQVDEARS